MKRRALPVLVMACIALAACASRPDDEADSTSGAVSTGALTRADFLRRLEVAAKPGVTDFGWGSVRVDERAGGDVAGERALLAAASETMGSLETLTRRIVATGNNVTVYVGGFARVNAWAWDSGAKDIEIELDASNKTVPTAMILRREFRFAAAIATEDTLNVGMDASTDGPLTEAFNQETFDRFIEPAFLRRVSRAAAALKPAEERVTGYGGVTLAGVSYKTAHDLLYYVDTSTVAADNLGDLGEFLAGNADYFPRGNPRPKAK